jgi:hypothetical protein
VKHGICKLCGHEGDLLNSHLMPASAYRPLTAPDSPNPNPVLIRAGTSYQTSRQTTAPLLCRGCEQVLNQMGERRVIPLLAKRDLSSPIYELLAKMPWDVNWEGMTAYSAAKNAEIPVEAIAHFALGVFWKASVHSWHAADNDPLINLGPYEKPLREHVLAAKDHPFPKNMALLVTLLPPPKIPLLLSSPARGPNGDGFRNFRFYVPGIQFVLSVGKTLDTEVCFISNPLHPICVSDIAEKVIAIPRRMYFRGRAIRETEERTFGKQLKRSP